MRKLEYLKLACKEGAWRRLGWRLSIFTQSMFPSNVEPEAYDLNFVDGVPNYFSPETNKWEEFEDATPNEPLFDTNDLIDIYPADYPGLTQRVDTTPGYLVFNWVVLYFAFEGRIAYFNVEQGDDPLMLESEIYSRCLVDGDDWDG